MNDRPITQSDVEAAQRGLRMVPMSLVDLDALMQEFPANHILFAGRVIHVAAKQMYAAKKRMGAQ